MSSTTNERIEYLGLSLSEIFRIGDLYMQQFARCKIDPAHTIFVSAICQAIDPGIHIHPVEIRKTEDLFAYQMKRGPIGNFLRA